MVEEAYVSFETARLLKEKGFNEPCRNYYSKSGTLRNIGCFNNAQLQSMKGVSCPTQQLAMRWLRETFGFHIYVVYIGKALDNGKPIYKLHIQSMRNGDYLHSEDCQQSVEEAYEIAIQYTLKNLIWL